MLVIQTTLQLIQVIYLVSIAGRIGGPAGIVVSVGDMMYCKVDGSPSGDQATVGANWDILEGNIDLSNITITGGTINGTTIATSNITVGAGKTLNVSAGTFTLADDQISGDKVEGGTIASILITTLASSIINMADAGKAISEHLG